MRTAIEGDDARFVNELLKDDDVPRRLKNLEVAAVPTAYPIPPTRNTACPQADIFIGIGRPALAPLGPFRLCSLFCLRGQRRNSSVGGIDNQRRSLHRLPRIAPERVIGT